MIDETNAYAVKINGCTFISLEAARTIVDEARLDGWNLALEEAAKVAENASFQFTQTTPSTVEVVDVRHTIAAAIRALKGTK